MKTCYRSLKPLLFMLVLCMVGTLSAWADSYTYTAAKADFKKGTFSFKSGDVSWSGNSTYAAPTRTESRGVQFGTKNLSNNTLTLSTSSIKGSIESIVVNTATAADCIVSLSVSVGGTQIGSSASLSGSAKDYTFTPKTTASGDIEISWNATKGSVYIKSITINYTSSSEPVDPTAVAAPIFSESSKSFSDKFELTLTKGKNAEMILYTTDGTEPSYEPLNGEEYTAAISIAHTTTVKAIALSNEGKESEVVTNEYKLELPAPVLSVSSKDFSEAFDVEISTPATAKEGILYTLDGSTPSWDNNSTDIYTDAINISATTTLKAVSYTQNGSDYEYSPVATATYTWVDPSVIWSEDFSGFENEAVPTKGENATYKCKDGKSKTMIYTEKLAGGTSPELLINQSGGSFSATISDLKGCKNGMILTFLDNQGNLSVSATNATILSKDVTKINKNHFTSTYIFALVDPSAEVSISMENKTSKNVRIDNIELSKYEKISSFNITEAGYATYYTSDAYAMPTGVTGYTITANNGSELTMKEAYTEGETVPAQTALVLKGKAGKYSFLPTTSTEITPADNKLHGSDVAAETHVDGTNVKYYKLSYDSKGANLGFYWGAENGAAFTNGAHKAYLALDGTTLLSQKQGFSFADLMNGLTTSINQANAANAAKQSIFDINGRRVNSWNGAAKGIYIVNGQKVLVK